MVLEAAGLSKRFQRGGETIAALQRGERLGVLGHT